jgi:hypothetical protein
MNLTIWPGLSLIYAQTTLRKNQAKPEITPCPHKPSLPTENAASQLTLSAGNKGHKGEKGDELHLACTYRAVMRGEGGGGAKILSVRFPCQKHGYHHAYESGIAKIKGETHFAGPKEANQPWHHGSIAGAPFCDE